MRASSALPVLAALLLLLAGCSAPPATPGGGSGAKALVVGTEAAFPPFENINASTGQFEGFDIDLARAIAGKLGRSPEFRNLDFRALIPSVQNQQVDMAISGMTINAERQQQVDFSLPYYEANQSVVVRSTNQAIRGPDDLANRTIGVQGGTTAEFWLVDNLVAQGKLRNASIVRYDSFPIAVQALERGDVEAVMMDAPAVKDAVRTRGGAIKLVFEVSTGEQYGIAIRKGNSDLLLGVNQALRDLQASGELQQLKQKWAI
jgi:polar amino acid transport system substrate-binding protein